jgi:hypothetical protein
MIFFKDDFGYRQTFWRTRAAWIGSRSARQVHRRLPPCLQKKERHGSAPRRNEQNFNRPPGLYEAVAKERNRLGILYSKAGRAWEAKSEKCFPYTSQFELWEADEIALSH